VPACYGLVCVACDTFFRSVPRNVPFSRADARRAKREQEEVLQPVALQRHPFGAASFQVLAMEVLAPVAPCCTRNCNNATPREPVASPCAPLALAPAPLRRECDLGALTRLGVHVNAESVGNTRLDRIASVDGVDERVV